MQKKKERRKNIRKCKRNENDSRIGKLHYHLFFKLKGLLTCFFFFNKIDVSLLELSQ